MLAALAMLGLGIFGPGIATGLVAGAPQLGAGAAAGTALGAAGLALPVARPSRVRVSPWPQGPAWRPRAARAAIGGGAAAARSASGLARSGGKSAYQDGAAASGGGGGVRGAGAGLAHLAKTGAGAVGQRVAVRRQGREGRVANFVADAAAAATASVASTGAAPRPGRRPPSLHGPSRCAASSN